MALADGYAAMPPVGKRVMGGSVRPANWAHGACDPVPFSRTRTTPDEDLALARKRQKELES
jgi:hypothetical protein